MGVVYRLKLHFVEVPTINPDEKTLGDPEGGTASFLACSLVTKSGKAELPLYLIHTNVASIGKTDLAEKLSASVTAMLKSWAADEGHDQIMIRMVQSEEEYKYIEESVKNNTTLSEELKKHVLDKLSADRLAASLPSDEALELENLSDEEKDLLKAMLRQQGDEANG